jgi:predicted nucleic acid-binding protein
MSKTYVVDNDFLDKLAKIDGLDLLRRESNKIVVTDKVYAELSRGLELKILSAP